MTPAITSLLYAGSANRTRATARPALGSCL
jgi:hypothetical protein